MAEVGLLIKVSLAIALTMIQIGGSLSALCPTGWTVSPESGSCIKLYTDTKTWSDARTACQDDGADLVKIVNSKMNNLISGEISAGGGGSYWIGLHDVNQQGTFTWLDDADNLLYACWGPAQPNNMDFFGFNNGNDCAEMGSLSAATEWSANLCNETANFICEQPCSTYAQDAVSCPGGWTASPESGTCIKLYNTEETWSDARSTCQAVGADLVKIVNDQMNELVSSEVKAGGGGTVWIGLHDRNEQGIFEWLDETVEAAYTNWDATKPSNADSDGHNCTEMSSLSYMRWNENNCTQPNMFMCERQAGVTSSVFCSPGWAAIEESGTCIKLYDTEKTWLDARAACQADKAELVKIMESKMNDLVSGYINASVEGSYWIGLHDRNKEGIFEWLDEGHQASFTNWDENEPNNIDSEGHDNGQDCVEIGFLSDFKWNDNDCTLPGKFICERLSGVFDPETTTQIATTMEPVDTTTASKAAATITNAPLEGTTKNSHEGTTKDSLEWTTKDSLEGTTKDSLEGTTKASLEGTTKDSLEGTTKGSFEMTTEAAPGRRATVTTEETDGTQGEDDGPEGSNSKHTKDKAEDDPDTLTSGQSLSRAALAGIIASAVVAFAAVVAAIVLGRRYSEARKRLDMQNIGGVVDSPSVVSSSFVEMKSERL